MTEGLTAEQCPLGYIIPEQPRLCQATRPGFYYADEVNSQFILIADILSDICGGVGILQSFATGARLILIIRLTADHGGVIAAQLQRRHKQLDVLALCHVLPRHPHTQRAAHASA